MKKATSSSSLLASPSQHFRTAAIPPPPPASAPLPVMSGAGVLAEAAAMVTTADAALPVKSVEREQEMNGGSLMIKDSRSDLLSDNNRANRSSSATSSASSRSSSSAQSQSDARKDSSVRVAVRIRPLLPKEIATNERVCVEREDNTITVSSAEKRFT